MKFTYSKLTPLLAQGDTTPETVHQFNLEGGQFTIEASTSGVRFIGASQWFQPVDEEMRIPEEFREFMVRVSMAFDLAWKEQERGCKETKARQNMLKI